MSDVSFINVKKAFGDVVALEDLDLHIRSGEFVSLLGPSGSGKSTTLNVLAGLLDADGGDILIGGRRVNDLTPDKRDIAMVFQNYALYPHLTIFENLAFPLRARGRRFSSAEISAKAESAAQLLGIEPLLARYPKELSGGQQQRVALGRAMIRDPQVFLLDEPLSNLDARLRIRMRRDIKALHERIGSTIVYVTHDQAEALTMSSKIAVFNHGRLQQFGAPSEIYNNPINMFVANFVGDREINFVPGKIEELGGVAGFRSAPLTLPLPRSFGGISGGTRGAVLGLRTESITAHATGGEGIPATVDQVELVGPDLVLYVDVQGQLLSCRANTSLDLRKGDPVSLVIDPGGIHIFDQETEATLAPISPVSDKIVVAA